MFSVILQSQPRRGHSWLSSWARTGRCPPCRCRLPRPPMPLITDVLHPRDALNMPRSRSRALIVAVVCLFRLSPAVGAVHGKLKEAEKSSLSGIRRRHIVVPRLFNPDHLRGAVYFVHSGQLQLIRIAETRCEYLIQADLFGEEWLSRSDSRPYLRGPCYSRVWRLVWTVRDGSCTTNPVSGWVRLRCSPNNSELARVSDRRARRSPTS